VRVGLLTTDAPCFLCGRLKLFVEVTLPLARLAKRGAVMRVELQVDSAPYAHQ